MLRLAGIILIALGVVALAYSGITWTSEKTVVDAGPLKVKTEEERTIPLPPVFGGLALIGGVVLVVVGARRGSKLSD